MPDPITTAGHLRPKVDFRYFALVDHYMGDEANPAAATMLNPTRTDPGFWTETGVTVDTALQKKIDDFLNPAGGPGTLEEQIAAAKTAAADPTLSNKDRELQEWVQTSLMRIRYLRFAVVNLIDPAHPRFAGNAGTTADPGTKADGHVEPLRKETVTGEERRLECWEAASTGKLSVLYAAHQLRFDLLALGAKNPGWHTQDDLFDGALMQWEKSQDTKATETMSETAFQAAIVKLRDATPVVHIVLSNGIIMVTRKGQEKAPRHERFIPLTFGAPKLKTIFDASKDPATGKWTVEFKGKPADGDLPARQIALKTASTKWFDEVPAKRDDHADFTFFDWMFLMIDASHNHATAHCIETLGYLYINSVMWQSGLFSLKRGGGLWMGWNYVGTWQPPPISDPPRKTPDGSVIWANTSAAAAVAFMTLLQQDKLVNAQACVRMKQLLDRRTDSPKNGSTDRCPFADILKKAASAHDYKGLYKHVFDKIGLGGRKKWFRYSLDSHGKPIGAPNVWDVALLARTATPASGTKELLYAAACLDSDTERPLQVLGERLDTWILDTT